MESALLVASTLSARPTILRTCGTPNRHSANETQDGRKSKLSAQSKYKSFREMKELTNP